MHLKINIILLISSCSLIMACDLTLDLERIVAQSLIKKGINHCYVKMPMLENAGYMPISFEGNFTDQYVPIYDYVSFRELNHPTPNPKIVRPDGEGYLLFKHNTTYKMACSENEFVSPGHYPHSEITVTCFNGSFEFEDEVYKFKDFKCIRIPVSKVIPTEAMCQGKKYNEILKVGFHSSNYFLESYRICFDVKHKNALYSWHYINTPMHQFNQVSKVKPTFIKGGKFEPINVKELYKDQNLVLKKMKKKELLKMHSEKSYKNLYLTPGHLVNEHEFVYVAERYATYFYENSAPQWYLFHSKVWLDVQKAFRRHLVKSQSKHLIVTGTIITRSNTSTSYEGPKLNMFSYDQMAVPDYFWKMHHHFENNSTIVYIGINNPYKRDENSVYICKTIPCPIRSLEIISKKTELFYCCTKKSFEKFYGEIDPIVYQEF